MSNTKAMNIRCTIWLVSKKMNAAPQAMKYFRRRTVRVTTQFKEEMIRKMRVLLQTVFAIFLTAIVSVVYAQPSQIEKLPLSISDPVLGEGLPVITIDGKQLFFTRARIGIDGSTVLDVWRSQLAPDGSFGSPEVMGGNLRSRYGIAVTSISPDNNSLYLIGKLRIDTPPEDRVMVAHKTLEGWSLPTPIHIKGLNVEGTVTDYSFGPDQQTLIMSVQRDSSLGGRDLYVSFLDENATSWSVPLWLGAIINSTSNEATPYLAADNKTLYFSSERAGGYGEMDVYRSTRLDDSWQHWSKPENIGPSINRPGRTSYYTEDAQGHAAYFVWRSDGNSQSDIFRAQAPKRTNDLTLITGKVLDETGAPLDAEIRYERLSDGKRLGLARSDPSSGEFQITLPSGETYSLHGEKTGYLPTSESFNAEKATGFTTLQKNLILVKIKENATIRLNNIFFQTDKAELLSSSFAELDRLRNILERDPSLRIAIEGHTDNTGSEAHNKSLSLGRAKAVVEYLITKGIAAPRLESHGYAAEKPVATNDTEEGKAQNRRVEFRIVSSEVKK
ncbi:MAG: OmpA family protein [Ignavibacteriota bacterium]